jgi:integrase
MAVIDDWKFNRGPKKGQMKPKSQQRGMRWRVTYPEPNNKNGIGEKFFDLKTDAYEFDAKKQTEKNQGTLMDEKGGHQLMSDYMWKWLDSLSLKPSTLAGYTGTIRNHLEPFFGRMQVAAVQRSDVMRWVKKQVEGGYAASTIWQRYIVLTGLMKAAVMDNLRGRTPCLRITNLPDKPSPKQNLKWLPTLEQVQAFAAHFPPRLRLAVSLAASCGLRYGELMGLAREDIDFKSGKVRVRRQLAETGGMALRTTKTVNSVRSVSVPPPVLAEVKAHLAAGYTHTVTLPDHTVEVEPGQPVAVREIELLFVAGIQGVRRGLHPVYRMDWSRAWDAAREAVGEVLADAPKKGFTVHTLRHLYVSWLIQDGASVIDVQMAVGHANAMTTINVYAWPTGINRAGEIMAARWATEPEQDAAAAA